MLQNAVSHCSQHDLTFMAFTLPHQEVPDGLDAGLGLLARDRSVKPRLVRQVLRDLEKALP